MERVVQLVFPGERREDRGADAEQKLSAQR